jgi:hypothetical protein
LWVAEKSFVSDALAFTVAKRIMLDRHGAAQVPVQRRLAGDLPLVVSQADEPIGDAAFVQYDLVPDTGGLDIAFTVVGRRKLPTRVECVLLNAAHEEIFRHEGAAMPATDGEKFTGRVAFDPQVIASDRASAIRRTLYGVAPLTWVLRLRDSVGDLIEEKLVPWRWRFPRRQ